MTQFTSFSRLIRLLGCVVLLLSTLSLTAAPPRWMRYLPKASNDNYRYVREDATAATEDVARNKAIGKVLQETIMSLGLPFNSKQVETAINTGDLTSKMAEWRVPVNVVCHYRQGLENGAVRVYVLCQVANAGNVDPHFEEFRNCGNTGDDYAGQMNLRPDAWSLYEMDTYFSAFEDLEIDPKADMMAIKAELEAQARQSLITNIALKDSALIAMIKSESQCFKGQGHAVAYINRDWVIDKYNDQIDEEVELCFGLAENADTYLDGGNIGEAKAGYLRVQKRLDDLKPIIQFMNAYSSTRGFERNMEDIKELNKQVKMKLLLTEGDTQKAREGKIFEYIQTAQNMISKQMIGDALRYFYAAQILLADMENSEYISIDDNGHKVSANTYLNTKITEVLKNIQVISDGYMPGSQTEMKLSFRYAGEPIANLNFSYNANMGWSDLFPVTNGWSSVILQENNKPSTMHIRIEYRYADEANFDAELPALIEKYASRFDYDANAKTIISVNTKTVRIGTTGSATTNKFSTNIAQNYVAETVEEEAHKVSVMDSVAYHNRILQVCEAIKSGNYESVYPLFTQDGYSQFQKLIAYGKARIITTEACRYVRIGTDIQCRSIPMSFTFPKSKQQLENVVFTFNNYGKIDGVQFALEEASARNVMGDNGIDELSRLTLVNFLENYKTAFALKRLDYIESIFSDDAVIITGRVLRTAEQSQEFKNIQQTMDNQVVQGNVLYTRMSKEHYIKRLKNSFNSKEWINIKFGGTTIDSSKQNNTFGVRLVQDYFSNNYGDHGYLFLLIDTSDRENPLIRVRMWQPEIDRDVQPFSMEEYDILTRGMNK
ncbi:MAG: hypothetical protein J6C57_06705 [Paludibacteraceae bacterium]|nr:hypothetical protein [Paludibacteraceae bacterium]